MAGFNPLAAAGTQALAQSSLAAIDLGVAIEILQQQLAVGDLLTATVLPPQGGADRLSLLGQTVLAQLPPGIDPGESLLLQVTGFVANQIVVRNLGVVDPQNPPPTATVTLPEPEPGAPLQATLTTVLPNKQNPAAAPAPPATGSAASPAQPPQQPGSPTQQSVPSPAAATAPPAAVPGPVAPPRAVFVAASVQPAPPNEGAPAPSLPPAIAAAIAGIESEVDQLGLEARIAATRAASLDIAELVNTPARPSGTQPPASQTPSVPTQPGAPPAAPAAAAAAPLAPASAPRVAQSQPAVAQASHEPVSPEEALLARLRVPVLPLTLSAARIASNAANALPRALARLDAALANVASQDPRTGSLRALIAFVSKLDPGNVRALPEQLMAFVSNAVDGAEGKLAAIVRQLVQFEPEETPSPESLARGAPVPPELPLPPAPEPGALTAQPATPQAPPPPAATPSAPAQATTPQPTPAAPAALPLAAAAHVNERLTALQYDLKATIASLADSPPRGAPAELAPALTEALTAVTAMQLNVLGAQNSDPSAITIPLPMFFHEQGRPVQLRISRDAPNGKKLDADNFHIAFVLDTQSLGTVAVDVQTVGRAVSVNVKTEGAPAASRFRGTLEELRGRLEQLHYRVANVAASVAPHRFGPAPEAAAPQAAPERTSVLGLDTQA